MARPAYLSSPFVSKKQGVRSILCSLGSHFRAPPGGTPETRRTMSQTDQVRPGGPELSPQVTGRRSGDGIAPIEQMVVAGRSLAAQAVTTRIPIVFLIGSDPTAQGCISYPQLHKQLLGYNEIPGLLAFCEPAVDVREQSLCRLFLALLAPQPSEVDRRSQFQ